MGTGELTHPLRRARCRWPSAWKQGPPATPSNGCLMSDDMTLKVRQAALCSLQLYTRVHHHAKPLRGKFGMGIRPLFHVKLKLMKRDIPSDCDHCTSRGFAGQLVAWRLSIPTLLRLPVRAGCVRVHKAQMQQAKCPSCAKEGEAPRPLTDA